MDRKGRGKDGQVQESKKRRRDRREKDAVRIRRKEDERKGRERHDVVQEKRKRRRGERKEDEEKGR